MCMTSHPYSREDRLLAIEALPSSEFAQLYASPVNGNSYILRFAPSIGANPEKELFIQRLLALSLVPIPPILHVGRLGACRAVIPRSGQNSSAASTSWIFAHRLQASLANGNTYRFSLGAVPSSSLSPGKTARVAE
jgi:hypothetical protein